MIVAARYLLLKNLITKREMDWIKDQTFEYNNVLFDILDAFLAEEEEDRDINDLAHSFLLLFRSSTP